MGTDRKREKQGGKNIVQCAKSRPEYSNNPPTVLLRPGVQLLLQVDDLDAKTLLAVRPLQGGVNSQQERRQRETLTAEKHELILKDSQSRDVDKLKWTSNVLQSDHNYYLEVKQKPQLPKGS